ncbi:MAG: single-strand DNA-binding protein [Actinomycetota bacterium]|jgi:single-strand DNA-binding protein|nr:single-strand DNA-binding protein [Actinomycetota bacterium]
MSDIITLTGVVATIPRAITTSEGLAITSFRLASTQRRFDRAQEKWVDGDTNWYTVTTFRQLAANAAVSVKKGERVVVTGRLRIRDWESGDKAGTNIDVEADAIGHDLSWGTAAFSRNTVSAPLEAHGDAEGAATFPTDAALAAIDAAVATDDSADGSTEGEAPTDRPAVLAGVGAENVTPF